MTQNRNNRDEILDVQAANRPSPRRLIIAGAAVAGLVLLIVLWKTFFVYVPPGKLLVVIAKTGADLPPEQVLAKKGQKGVQEEVLGEGYHFIWPIFYTTEVKDLTVVPPDKFGIVTALGGDRPEEGRVLAELPNEQGIRRQVLLPGAYRLNPNGFQVELVDREAAHCEIHPGYVGVQRRLLGKDGTLQFADKPDEKGILRDVLQPGIYFINTKEFEITPCEVGIYQTTYSGKPNGKDRKGGITFRAKDGYSISVECTIEWEVLPDDWPSLVAVYGTFDNIERNVVNVQVEQICRNRGFNYGAEDFLDGTKREAFQLDFMHELEKACREKNVVVRTAFIRNITIPEEFLLQKRKLQLSVETQRTNKDREKTIKSEADILRQQAEINQQVAQVQAETTAKAAQILRQVENVQELTKAEIDTLKADYNARIAALEAEKTRDLGVAEAKVKEMKETATSSIFKLKMDAFENNGDAYMRYSLAEKMNPNLKLRLFQSGPGTFWTNLDGKSFNLMVNPPTGTKAVTEK